MLNETYRAMLAHKSVIRETFMYGKQRAAEIGYENVFDYSLGNPSVPCPPRFTAAMQRPLACPMSRSIFSPPRVPRAPLPMPSAL